MSENELDSVSYWETRAEQRIMESEKEANKMLIDLRGVYTQTKKEIEKEIYVFYGKYAQETGLSLEEIYKKLSPKELLSAKEDIEIYYKEVNRLGGYSPTTKSYLRGLSARAYISRLEELKFQMAKRIEDLYRLENSHFESGLMQVYENTYYKTNFDIQKGFGFSMPFSTLNDDMVAKVISQKWIGDNFSNRIWKEKDKLLNALETKFAQGVALGHNPRKIASNLKTELDTKYSNCERLARTEFNHTANQASLDSYKEYSTTPKYKIVATLDSRTSKICQQMDGKVFNVSEAKEGVNFPLFHPNCRTTTIPYFEEDEIDKLYAKAKRVSDSDFIDSDITYDKWREQVKEKNE